MPKYGSADVAFFLVDGYDLKADLTTFRLDVEAILEETHGLGAGWVEALPVGLRRATLEQEGFFDDALDRVHAALGGQQEVRRIVTVGVEGNVAGRRVTGIAGAFASRYNRQATRGELHKASASYRVVGQVEEGVLLHPLRTETAASGNTEGAESVDGGAASSGGGAGYLQVQDLTLGGYTSVTIKMRHSADDVTYADLVTFANVTAAKTAQRVAVSGTVQRHLAHSWAFNGTGSSPSIRYAVGFARG
ncbi:MAG TPA: hypothetical protein VNI83_04615 [Vicinamibacterales bacterium]|nr:hypothetical protein [Vicinamibacterales bacterium]